MTRTVARSILACLVLVHMGQAATGPLTYTFIRNLAINKPALAPLADLADFSVRLLDRAGANRARIAALNREVKNEANAQYHAESLHKPVRTGQALRQWIQEEYWSLSSPDLIKLQVTKQGIQVHEQPHRLDWPLGERVTIPVIVANELDQPTSIRSAYGNVKVGACETKGEFLEIVPEVDGEHTQEIHFSSAGHAATVSFPVRVWKTADLTLKIEDEAGRPTAARVYVTGADGMAYAPKNALRRIPTGDYGQPFAGEPFFYTEGESLLRAPAGKTKIEVVKGFEYASARREQDLKPNQPASVTIRLRRFADLPQRGWYSGETHIHANAINNLVVTPQDLWLITRAEDLNIAETLVNNYVDGVVTDRQWFEGRPHRLSNDRYILRFDEEMRNFGLYGHMGFLNLKRIVEPMYTGFPHTHWDEDYPANFLQAQAAKRQGAAVTYVHPGDSGEYPIDLALGAMDALDVMSQGDEMIAARAWYKLLNCGLRCAISAGTDSFANVMYHLIPGANRVYVHTGPRLTYAKWIEGYRLGNSFATNGPLLFLTVDGREPGSELRLPAGPASLRIQAEAFSQVPMSKLEILVNGNVVASGAGSEDALRIERSITVRGSSWIAARVTGPAYRLVPNDTGVFAHTSPIYCFTGEQRIASREDARAVVAWIDRLIDRVSNQSSIRTPERKQEVLEIFRRGRAYYERIAE